MERKAGQIQYVLACLSTLGGAHHLCNKPNEALKLAIQQEYIGYILGSTQIILRAQVFQAVNYAILGYSNYSKKCFKRIIKKAKESEDWCDMISFAKASQNWLKGELASRNEHKGHDDDTKEQQQNQQQLQILDA